MYCLQYNSMSMKMEGKDAQNERKMKRQKIRKVESYHEEKGERGRKVYQNYIDLGINNKPS